MIAARRMLAKKMALNSLSSQVRVAMPLLAAQQRTALMACSAQNMLMMNTDLTASQIEFIGNKSRAGEQPELKAHLRRMMECAQKIAQKKGPRGSTMQSCIAQSECITERVKFSNCIYQYQKSPQLCKVYKRDMVDCFGQFAKTYNMVLHEANGIY